jgi:hypothetical protein
MKNKLRKITIDNNVYLYIIRNDYYSFGANKLTLTIFLNGHKQTPLVIDFLTLDDLYKGEPLHVGVQLLNVKTNELLRVNINEPKYIREFILLGFKNGWTGTNIIANQIGLDYLTEMGFEVNPILQKNLQSWWSETTVFKDALTDATFPIADKLLEKQGTFSPFAAVITEDDTILNLTNEMQKDLPQEEAVNNWKKIVKADTITNHYVGCVILYIDRVVNLFTNKTIDAVAIYYESTREKKRWIYYYPYRFTAKKRVTYLRSWGAIADKEVFI